MEFTLWTKETITPSVALYKTHSGSVRHVDQRTQDDLFQIGVPTDAFAGKCPASEGTWSMLIVSDVKDHKRESASLSDFNNT